MAEDRDPTPLEESQRSRIARELAADRARTARRVDELARDHDRIVDAARMVSTDDEHDPEGATIAYERAKVAALLDQARVRLAELDRSADRLAEPGYGVCERCAGPIGFERLLARPAATTCVVCASSS